MTSRPEEKLRVDDVSSILVDSQFGGRAELLGKPLLESCRRELGTDFAWLCWRGHQGGLEMVGRCPAPDAVHRIWDRASRADSRETAFNAESDWDLASCLALWSSGIPGALLVVADRDPRSWTDTERERLGEIDRILTDLLEMGGATGGSDSPFHQLFSRAGDMIAVTAGDGTFAYVSDSCHDLLGLSADELIGKSAYEFFHTDDAAQLRHVHSQLLSSDRARRVTHRMRQRDGSWIWVETHARRLTSHRKNNGPVLTITRSVQDEIVNEPRRTAENWFWSVFSGALNPMALVDLDTTFLQVNESFCELLGYTSSELLATKVERVSPPEDDALARERLRTLATGDAHSVRFARDYVRKDGTRVRCLSTVVAVPDRAGQPEQFVCVVQPEKVILDTLGSDGAPREARGPELARSREDDRAVRDSPRPRMMPADDTDTRRALLQEIMDADESRVVLDHLAQIAARTLGTPVAQVNLVFPDRQCSLSSTGPGAWEGPQEVPIEASICRHVLGSGENLLISDAETDPVTSDQNAVLEKGLRAYAAVPVRVSGDMTLGTLCVVDFVPREWAADDIELLEDLAHFVGRELEERILMRHESHRLAALVDSSPVPVFAVDLDGVVTTWSRAAEIFFDLPRASALGSSVTDILPERLVAVFYPDGETSRAVLGTEEVWCRRGSDDRHACTVATLSPLEDLAGRTTGTVVTLRDVTEQREREAREREATSRLRYVLSVSPVVTYILSWREDELVPTWVTDNVEEVLGFAKEDVLSPKWWRRHVHPSDIDQAERGREKLFDDGRFSREYRLRKADGEYIWVNETMRLVEDPDGRPVEVIGSWMDVTEQVRVDEATQVAARTAALGRMTGAIAHDINNIFAAVQAAAELILIDSEDVAVHDHTKELLESVDRGSRFVRQLLTVSRDAPQERRPIDLAESVRNMVLVAGTVLGNDIELQVDLDEAVPAIEADPSQIEQVLLNLLVNARDALEGEGNVWIEVTSVTLGEGDVHGILESGEHVRLIVRDDGPGIPKDVREHIFEPFFTTKSPEKGTGLGLSTVYGIVRQHEGRIRVRSREGEGAAFEILIPVSASEAPAGEDSSHGTDTVTLQGEGCVLLVEDQDAVRRGLRRLLERTGFHVLEASDGPEALAILDDGAESPRLLITDLMMPKMKGTELVRRVRERLPGLPSLLMTGFAEEEILEERTADMDLLEKPFEFETLLRRIEDVLER